MFGSAHFLNSPAKAFRGLGIYLTAVLLGWAAVMAASTAQAQTHQVFSKVNGVQVGYHINTVRGDPYASIDYSFYDTRPIADKGGGGGRLRVRRSDLENNVPIEGTLKLSLPLPGCNFYNASATKYSIKDGVFELSMIVRSEELWNEDCKKGFIASGPEIKLTFPALTRNDRERFGLAPTPGEAKPCNLVVGRNLQIDDIVGKDLFVYPNAAAYDLDVFNTVSQAFADMTIGTMVQSGPDAWRLQKSFVFRMGDVVTVKSVARAPRPGAHAGARAYLVEVTRRSDGLSGVVDLDQLISGSPTGCYPSTYIGTTRKIAGVFVKVKQGAKLLTASNNREWINNPAIRYGYCQDFQKGYFSCQTRAHDKSKWSTASDWLATPEEVDVMLEFPPELKDLQFRG